MDRGQAKEPGRERENGKEIRKEIRKDSRRLVYLDAAKGMGILGVVASHCLVQTSLGAVSLWYDFFMLAIFYVYTGWRYALRYGTDPTGICFRRLAGRRLCSLGIPYVCYSLLFMAFRVFLVWPASYTPMVFLSDIYYTVTLVGLETLWFLPSMFLAELLLNSFYGKWKKMGLAAALGAAASIFLILWINGGRQDTTLWRITHLPLMVYIKGLVGFLLASGGAGGYFLWKWVCRHLGDRMSAVLSFCLLGISFCLTSLVPRCDFNYLTMQDPLSWIGTALFASGAILMVGERLEHSAGAWKQLGIIKKGIVPVLVWYGRHSLTVMCTHLVPVIAAFRVIAGKLTVPGILDQSPWDLILLGVVLVGEPFVVKAVERSFPWLEGKGKKCL